MTELIWKIFGLFFSITTILPFLNSKHWFFRIPDFLRLQLTGILVILLLFLPLVFNSYTVTAQLIVVIILAAIGLNLTIILPYVPFKQIKTKKLKQEIVVLSINVQQENHQFERLKKIVQEIQPDILLTMETDKTWENHLQAIEKYFTHFIRVPKSNKYGMHLYTKLTIKEHQVHYLITKEHPSIEATFVCNNKEFVFWGIHPPPPSPTEKTTSKQKDAALLKAAKIIRNTKLPVVITGDFNNVTWSKTSKLFRNISKLKDARINRGIYPTFPSYFRILGFPIDLLFHSKSITIGNLKTLKSIGSDHLPMQFSFALDTNIKEQHTPLNDTLKDLVKEHVNEGKKAAKTENLQKSLSKV